MRERRAERALAQRIRQGDADAVRTFVRAHYERVYRYLAHLCRDVPTAEDLTQETFTSAWRAIGRFGGTSSLATWLHRIARNAFLDHCRRRRRRPPVAPGDVERPDGRDPLAELLADEQRRRLHAAVEALAAAERESIVLHYFQGLSYRQMAEVLDEPVGTVKWRTGRALKQLNAILTGESDHANRTRQHGR